MAEGTRRRGAADTARNPFQLVRVASRRLLFVALAVAALLHLPLVPTSLFAWLELALMQRGEFTDYDAGETIIPLDLDLLDNEPSIVDQAPSSSPEASAPTPSAAPPASTSEPVIVDAGPPAKPDAAPDKPDAGTKPDDGAPNLRDPLAVAGSIGKLASKEPNVQVLIAGDRLRQHELGSWFGTILTTIPEWQSFFKDTPIDPIRDLDHLLIAGPQFRDSRKVVAIMDYRVPEATMHDAINVLVERTKGHWIENAPVPAARAKAHRGDRIFALVPQKRLLVVIPADEEDQLPKLKNIKSFNKSSAAGIVISMLTPANAFAKLYKLPTSLKWMKLAVTPTPDGGADVALTLGDSDVKEAQNHAKELTDLFRTLRQATTVDLGIVKVEALNEVKFAAERDLIWAKTHFTSKQLKLIMGFVEQALKDQAAAQKKKQDEAENKKKDQDDDTYP